MLCYLLRHGEAESDASNDRLRALTPRGRADNQAVVEDWQARDAAPGKILASPLLRAMQTAEQVAQHFAISSITQTELLTPDADLPTLMALLEQHLDEQPLLVGHNPLLSRLLTQLAGDEPTSHLHLDTSQLVCLDTEVVATSCAVIKYQLTP
ncbi:MAG: phosphohistidine phosphatase SixA [Pseudohongiellaceae bacterium]